MFLSSSLSFVTTARVYIVIFLLMIFSYSFALSMICNILYFVNKSFENMTTYSPLSTLMPLTGDLHWFICQFRLTVHCAGQFELEYLQNNTYAFVKWKNNNKKKIYTKKYACLSPSMEVECVKIIWLKMPEFFSYSPRLDTFAFVLPLARCCHNSWEIHKFIVGFNS